MSETSMTKEMEALLVQVRDVCGQNAARQDPVRMHYVRTLAGRMLAAVPSVQKVLQTKLEAALNGLGGDEAARLPVPSDLIEAGTHTGGPARRKGGTQAKEPRAPRSPLAQLHQHIEAASGLPQDAAASRPLDLRSAIRFRETWARISAETEVDKATHRAPENAGPLNAHHLVLRTLGLMRDLSPDYLRRFMGHAESLLWLDLAYGQLKQSAGKSKAPKRVSPKV
jgi:hypothetical protein